MPQIMLNGQRVRADAEEPLIKTLHREGITVPSLCYHPALTPAGECKLCAVLAAFPGKAAQIRLSCVTKPVEGLEVRTDTPEVQRAREKAFRTLAAYAPEAPALRKLAEKYGIDLGEPPDECIRCWLCVRACKELVGAGALDVGKRKGRRFVVPKAGNRCIGCCTCVSICPTGALRREETNGLCIISIRDEIIGRNPLLRCESCGRYFATANALSRIETRIGEHPHVKSHHRYCPDCAKRLSDRLRSASRIKKM